MDIAQILIILLLLAVDGLLIGKCVADGEEASSRQELDGKQSIVKLKCLRSYLSSNRAWYASDPCRSLYLRMSTL